MAILAGILISAARVGLPEPDLRALVFTSLVVANMGLILVNRSFSASLIRAFLRPNRSLRILFGGVIALLGIGIFWPPAQSLFGFARLHWDDLAVIAVTGLLSLLLLEGLKSRLFKPADARR